MARDATMAGTPAPLELDRLALWRRLEAADVVREIVLKESTVQAEVAACLHGLVRELRPEATLEVGLALGFSAIAICLAHLDRGPRPRHLAIDPAQSGGQAFAQGLQREGFRGCGIANLRAAGAEAAFEGLREAESFRALPALFAEGRRFGLIFVDGMHTFDYVLVDCFYADLLLVDGGLLVLDDLWLPAVQHVLSFLLANRSYCVQHLAGDWPEHLKLYAVLRKLGPDARSWDHFEPFGTAAGGGAAAAGEELRVGGGRSDHSAHEAGARVATMSDTFSCVD